MILIFGGITAILKLSGTIICIIQVTIIYEYLIYGHTIKGKHKHIYFK